MRSFSLLFLLSVSTPSFAAEPAPAPDYANLGHQTAVIGGLSLAAMSFLWSLPAESSQWYDKPPLTAPGLYRRWRDNTSAGPVWDGDMRIFNGYGHIHTGAATSVLCLDNGLSVLACTAYANVLSIFWEYGPEALVEVPSWQDILMTGLVGSRVGVQFVQWKRAIASNGGELFGSSVLGSVATFLLDPAGSVVRGIQNSFSAETTFGVHPEAHGLALDFGVRF